jgi:hypothetical protein
VPRRLWEFGPLARAATTAFWCSATGLAWLTAGYPAFLAVRPPRTWEKRGPLPAISVVVAALDEREILGRKLSALAEADYPADLLQVVVAVDEDEATRRIAAESSPDAIVLYRPERAGKTAALERAVQHATGDVIVFTDANNLLAPESLRAAARHFSDPSIVVVVGRRGERGSAYDRYEDALRRLETKSGSVAAANGEFLAIRRSHLPGEWDRTVVNDDFWLYCRALEHGGRAVYEPAACSVEDALPIGAEIERRSRMGAGRVAAIQELLRLPPSLAGRVASHKFGRLAMPPLLAMMLVSSLALARRPGYRVALLLQATGYGVAAASVAGLDLPGPLRPASRAARQFVLGNVAVGRGLIRGLTGRQSHMWARVR